jgi:protein dithiol:quinone oxidoreductase
MGLLGYAYYAQYHLHLEPCPLCILQRLGFFLTGVLFLIAAIHGPHRDGAGRRMYSATIALASLATIAVAARQLYIQGQPPGTIPDCGAPLAIMMKLMSPGEVLSKVLAGSGECAKVDWRLLGLAMPAWVLISAAALGAFGIWANGQRTSAAIRP